MNVEVEIKNFGQCIPEEDLPYVLRNFIVVKNHVVLILVGKEWGLQFQKYSRAPSRDLTVRSNDKETVFTVKLPQYKK